MGITSKQQEDINFAIQEYLGKQGYVKSAEAFADESKLDYEAYLKSSNMPQQLLKDVLERKWTSIAKLKKQVMDLERQCKQLKETNE